MPANVTLPAGVLFGFLLVLMRVSGALVFIPLPGMSGMPGPARAGLALGFTLALFSQWPNVNTAVTPFTLAAWVAAEAAAGILMGVAVAITLEAFTFAAQVLGMPAGYGYASTVDPNTQADSGILLVFAQLVAGMLFFSLGLDREVLTLIAQSLDRVPPGTYIFSAAAGEPVIRLASSLFSVGVRLALPVVALLVMVDVALALLGRLNAQLQLLSLAFPVKMLISLAVLSWIAVLFPRILRAFSAQAWTTVRRVLGT